MQHKHLTRNQATSTRLCCTSVVQIRGEGPLPLTSLVQKSGLPLTLMLQTEYYVHSQWGNVQDPWNDNNNTVKHFKLVCEVLQSKCNPLEKNLRCHKTQGGAPEDLGKIHMYLSTAGEKATCPLSLHSEGVHVPFHPPCYSVYLYSEAPPANYHYFLMLSKSMYLVHTPSHGI